MIIWTEDELKKYREMMCSEKISSACNNCKQTANDITECFESLDLTE